MWWPYIWQELIDSSPAGVLTVADSLILAVACRLEAEYRRTGPDMPAAKIGQLLRCLCKLGMDPADRAGVPIPEPP
jgi:hypothetical protein